MQLQWSPEWKPEASTSPRAEQDAAATTAEVAAIRPGSLLKTGEEADHIHLRPQLWVLLHGQTLPAGSEL